MLWSCHYDCHDMEPNVHGNLSSTCWFVSLEVGTKNIAKLHILMCADVYPMVALKCLLRIRRYQIPHETHFFHASFGCTPHYIPSKNFRFSSILTPQCFHILRFIFMWTFMSSCSRVQTTHAVRLPSHLFCPLRIGSAELVAFSPSWWPFIHAFMRSTRVPVNPLHTLTCVSKGSTRTSIF